MVKVWKAVYVEAETEEALEYRCELVDRALSNMPRGIDHDGSWSIDKEEDEG